MGRSYFDSNYFDELVFDEGAQAVSVQAALALGLAVSASELKDIARSAAVLIGNQVTSSKAIAMDRDSLVLIGNLVAASRAGAVVRLSSILVGVSTSVLTSPTNHIPGSGWSDEPNAYDGVEATYASETIS